MKKHLCVSCRKTNRQVHPILGVLPYCQSCQLLQDASIKKVPEMAGESIKNNREMHWDDIHPAHYKGHASREFLEKYGKKAMLRQGFSEKEIKEAKYVYNSDRYYKRHA